MSIIAAALPGVQAISPYQPGKPVSAVAREIGLAPEGIIKLASNENPLGMSPRARAAAAAALDGAARYPDQHDLVAALAQRHGVAREQIVLGNGSNDVLELAARVFLEPGRSAVLSRHAFAVYGLATLACGAEALTAPARKYGHDPDAMLAAIRPDSRVLWIANPNNPTGTLLSAADIGAMLRLAPADTAVVLDEAYNEYLAPADCGDSISLLAQHRNLIITRTFSKIYGMAGLRIGYAVADAAVADLMNRVRQPFNANHIAIAAALAALDDHDFVADSAAVNRRGMARMQAGLDRLGLDYIPSHGNFISFAVADAAAVNRQLMQQGVIVRPIGGYDMPDHLRVSIGLESENERFLSALEQVLA